MAPRIAVVACSVLALSGCADMLMQKSSESVAVAIKGKPIQNAVNTIGIPADDKIIAGMRVVTWKVGDGVRGNYGCELRVVVDSTEVVSRYEIEGSRGACYNWLHDLK